MTRATVAASNESYSAWITRYEPGGHADQAEGSAGVREPCRPIQPSLSGGASLVLPADHDSASLAEAIALGQALALKYGWSP